MLQFLRGHPGLTELELELVKEESRVLHPSLLRLHTIRGIRVLPAESAKGIVECANVVSLCDATPEKSLTKCEEVILVRRHTTGEDGMDRTHSKVAFLKIIADLSAAVLSGQRVLLLIGDATLALCEWLTFLSSLPRGFP
jgi:hypothetical protein